MSSLIVPFSIETDEEEIADLKQRLSRTRWPDAEPVTDWSQGLPLSYAQEIAHYWAEEYDWTAAVARLNRFPQIRTEIDGLSIHAQHIRSPHDNALPLIITHGWPGSIVEFQKVIEPLTDPTQHGGEATDAFHLVLPSLPGYGWSDKPTEAGWGLEKIATSWNTLMTSLGYSTYVAQGGDWGSAVTTQIGMQDLGHCTAIHINMPVAGPDPDTMGDLTPQEQDALQSFGHYDRWDSGYSKQQSTRPQTLGYGLADSPAGQMGWILEKFWAWTDCDGHPENALSRDDMLDNISTYWFTNSGASSGRLYWESFAQFAEGTVDIPTGCSIFPKEIIRSSQRWASKRYTNIQYWNELSKGGHFAAFEQPDLFVNEIRNAFRPYR